MRAVALPCGHQPSPGELTLPIPSLLVSKDANYTEVITLDIVTGYTLTHCFKFLMNVTNS